MPEVKALETSIEGTLAAVFGHSIEEIADRGAPGEAPIAVATPALDLSKVFVVHGRDDEAKNEVARFLERMGLGSVTWLRSRPLPISASP